ncbi:acyltransferase domain-containing protein [Sphaerospermopsis aphanizomenoides BCCUSP55]|uniref:type I polyketide synthase n=1 Tax=Sphaerospermopsis aphanizomenoides TaxID=459663 RepID=UPI0019088FB7|nr:type I polyketide synthase [Sphaerospermopsis aphanizomenoides]MBK1989424.1 acyltransferase domain-containing protein [Sphaerospermopsis aphanizomenoides BCCUSP55]
MISTNPQLLDIAIIGMSSLFAGSRNVDAFWQNILKKIDHVQDAPDDWAVPYFDPNSSDFTELSRIYTRKVGLLGDLAEFNPLEFGVPPTSVSGSEPDHFLALKLARDALQDSGYLDRQFNRERTGIILGRGATPNRGTVTGLQHGVILDQLTELFQKLLPELDQETLTEIRNELKASVPPLPPEAGPGLVSNIAVGRIANRLDLKGPSYMIDAACSSSLIAAELAIKELRSGQSDMMLVGGVQASMPPQIYMLFCKLKALSRTKIRPFDQAAAGTLLGEGCGFLVLKRLADAERDGDKIYAVLKQVGLSSDGKALGLLAPRLEGEVLALERAYSEADIDPATVSLIEAHGTGIPVGDKTEIKALTQVFGSRQGKLPQCGLGSVKSMIGHCIPASGIAGFIKLSLALHHKILPPTLCDQVNPDLGLEETPFYINTQTRPWIHGNQESPRRAGISAFGFGGVNAHAILEEYTGPNTSDQQFYSQWPHELFIFSGENKQDLLALGQQVQQYLQANPLPSLVDLAFTLASYETGNYRLAIVAENANDLQKKLKQALEKIAQPDCQHLQTRNGVYYATPAVNSQESKTAFLFPGEGSQYVNMLADLCLYFPGVREWFDISDATFTGLWETLPSQFVFPPPTCLTDEEKQMLSQGLYNIDVATETVFTADIALYHLLSQFGIKPDVMVGHSTGEYAALSASGIIQADHLDDQIKIKRNLNQIYKELEAANTIPRGVLLTVGALDSQVVENLLQQFEGKLFLAMDNCPNQKILFGAGEVIKEVAHQVKTLGGIYQELPFDRAYHTPLFLEMGQVLIRYYADLPVGTAHTPLYSCASVAPFPNEADAIRELVARQWSSRVRFSEIIERLYEEGVRTFIEVGPSNNLTSFVEDILRKREFLAIASNSQRKSGLEQLLLLLGRLFVKGTKLDWTPLYQCRNAKLVDLDSSNAATLNQKSSPVLNLLVPKMSLSSELIEKVRSKLGEHGFKQLPLSKENEPIDINVSSSARNSIALDKFSPVSETRVITETASEAIVYEGSSFATPVEPTSQEAASQVTTVTGLTTSLSPEVQLSVVSLHFELMQEFLANQSKVSEAFFSIHADSTENVER